MNNPMTRETFIELPPKNQNQVLFDQQNDIKRTTETICDLLKGADDKPGLTTRVAVNTASLTRLWWWVGALSMIIGLGSVGWVIKGAIAG